MLNVIHHQMKKFVQIQELWDNYFVKGSFLGDVIILVNYPKDHHRVREYISVFGNRVLGFQIDKSTDSMLVQDDFSILYEAAKQEGHSEFFKSSSSLSLYQTDYLVF